MRKIDFLVITGDQNIKNRCGGLAQEYGYSFRSTPTVDTFSENEAELKSATLVLLDAEKVTNEADIAGMVQVVKYVAPESYIIVSIDARLDATVAVFVKKSGANLVLMGTDIRNTSKLEYAASQKINSSYLPINVDELLPMTIIDCNIYHSLPLNKKFLPIITAGTEISEQRIHKIQQVKSVYVRRADIGAFQKYCEKYHRSAGVSSSGQVRGRFLSLASSYADLILLIIDHSEKVSYGQGVELYNQCEALAHKLMETIGNVENGWEIIQESATGTLGGLERSAPIAAYAGLMCLKAKAGDHFKMVISALLADIGALDFTPELHRKIRHEVPMKQWSEEEQSHYKKHQVASLNLALSRKFQVTDDIKETILCSHESLDGTGFPNTHRKDKIPLESFVLQVAERIDRASFIPMGKAGPKIEDAKKLVIDKYVIPLGSLNFVLAEKLKSSLL